MLLISLSLYSASAWADYVDVGMTGDHYTISSKFYANGVIINAESSEYDKFGLGFGFKKQDFTVLVGAGYIDNLEGDIYVFTDLLYKNERHSIYDVSIESINGEVDLKVGYTLLFSERAGLVLKGNHKELFTGLRVWF